jgi:hypothetical protein
MSIRFPARVLIFTAILGGIIYALHLQGLVIAANEVHARFVATGLFAVGFLLIVWQKAKHHRFSWKDFYGNGTLIIVSLTLLLASIFFSKHLSYYLIGLFVLACFVHVFYTRKIYVPPTFFYFIVAYGLLMFFGTIGTQKGFRFPDKILSFFVLPLAYCFFNLPKKTLLQVGEVFFKTGVIYLLISVLYWWFNYLHLGADFTTWITGKSGYIAQMIGWESQAGGNFLWQGPPTKDTPLGYPAYFFVNSWSHFHHPTAKSIVLLGGLITGFYLYYKKDEFSTVSKWDLLLYTALCLLTIMLMQSRIGVVGFLLIIGITGLYYLKQKTNYFKIGLLTCLLFGGIIFAIFNDKITDFTNDDTRKAYRHIAVSYIHENFWWGSGFEQQRLVLEAQAEIMKDELPAIVYPHSEHPITHVHNQFLDNMVQFGIWGLIVLIAMLAAIAYYAIKNRSYLLATYFCFIFCAMWIEGGEFIITLIFITFFAAISEAEKRRKSIKNNLTE